MSGRSTAWGRTEGAGRKVLLRLGKAGVAGERPDTVNQPSGVVIASDSGIFVAMGLAAMIRAPVS